MYDDLSCSDRRELRDNLSRGYIPEVDEVRKRELLDVFHLNMLHV